MVTILVQNARRMRTYLMVPMFLFITFDSATWKWIHISMANNARWNKYEPYMSIHNPKAYKFIWSLKKEKMEQAISKEPVPVNKFN